MAKLARDVMTPDPACCTPTMTLDQVATLMVQNDCGEIPVVDSGDQYMSQPVVTVRADAPLDEVVSTMEKHQIRRVPVVDERGCCAGIIAQADVAWTGSEHDVSQLVREMSRDTGDESR